MVQVTRNARVTGVTAISSDEVASMTEENRRRFIGYCLDELLLTIDEFFSRVPGEFRPDLRSEYLDVCRVRLGVSK